MHPWQNWFNPFWMTDAASAFYAPLSGATTTTTDWFSPDIDITVGDPRIERAVTHNVATYGKQLGMIMEAVLELAKTIKHEDLPSVRALRGLSGKIENEKKRGRDSLEARTLHDLETLKSTNPEGFLRVMEQISSIDN